MGPEIGRSLREGFRAANRSWAGMGVVAGAWIVTVGVLFLLVMITNPPWEALQEQLASNREAALAPASTTESIPPAIDTPLDVPSSNTTTEPAAEPVMTAPETTTPAATDETTAPAAAQPSDSAQPAPTDIPTAPPVAAQHPVTPIPQTPAMVSPAEAARTRAIEAWVGRAWPVFLLGFLLIITVTLWLQGGKIGYLAKQVAGQPAGLADFWGAGVRALGPLFVTSLLSLLATVGMVALLILASWALSLLPSALGLVIGVLLMVAVGAGLLWLLVRLTFWLIAIVVDQLRPLAGLRAGFRATRGHWWKIFGLLAVFVGLFLAVGLVFALVDWLGNRVGGAAGIVITQASALIQLLVTNLYGAFAMTAALIRCYKDLTAPAAAATPPAQVP